MTPQDAVMLLYQVTAKIAMTREDHDRVKLALATVDKVVKAQELPVAARPV